MLPCISWNDFLAKSVTALSCNQPKLILNHWRIKMHLWKGYWLTHRSDGWDRNSGSENGYALRKTQNPAPQPEPCCGRGLSKGSATAVGRGGLMSSPPRPALGTSPRHIFISACLSTSPSFSIPYLRFSVSEWMILIIGKCSSCRVRQEKWEAGRQVSLLQWSVLPTLGERSDMCLEWSYVKSTFTHACWLLLREELQRSVSGCNPPCYGSSLNKHRSTHADSGPCLRNHS